ncbi:MAG: hypothetical protein N2738_06170, partial [Thermodesulfovibrionales bacterium]|nr:hypothetical protein [Thermodesulfovibrionales bacterium]
VKELAEAQKKTEQRLDSLTQKVEELAEAQRQTDEKVKELAEAQKKTEQRLDSLTQKVEELAEAQRQTDEKIKELIEAQRQTDEKVRELAEAQRRTEATLEKVIVKIDRIEERLEGISNGVGYSLENSAYKSLPGLLEPLGIKVNERMIRKYINGYQVNIFAKAEKDGKEVYVIGECKVRPSKKEIDRFLKIVDNIKEETAYDELIPIFVAHDYLPEIEKYIKAKGIINFWSYEL